MTARRAAVDFIYANAEEAGRPIAMRCGDTLLIGVFAIVANGILLAIDNRLHWR